MATVVDPGPAANAVREAREKMGWSQSELARQTGLTQPFISQIESGIKQYRSGTALAIADATNTEEKKLLRWATDRPSGRSSCFMYALPDLPVYERSAIATPLAA